MNSVKVTIMAINLILPLLFKLMDVSDKAQTLSLPLAAKCLCSHCLSMYLSLGLGRNAVKQVVGLLTGHNALRRHFTLISVAEDAGCGQEEASSSSVSATLLKV